MGSDSLTLNQRLFERLAGTAEIKHCANATICQG